MKRLVWLSVVFSVFLASISADPTSPRSAENEVTWSDDFKSDSLKNYKLKGTPTWEKGHVILPSRVELIRQMPMGLDAEAEIDVEFPTIKEIGSFIVFRRGPALRDVSVAALGVQKGKLVLVILEEPFAPHEFEGEVKPGDAWTLKFRVRYGLEQAKAWPKGKTEPKEWQYTRYGGASDWEPRSVHIAGGWTGDTVRVTRFAVRGTKPITDFFLKEEPEDSPKQKAFLRAQYVAVLRKGGEIKRALAMARDTLDDAKKAYGPEHPFIAICLQNLAATLHDAGDYDESLKTFELAVKVARKTLPADHPQIALGIEGIGAALAAKGEWDEAEKKYREVLAFRRRVLGDEHPETATAWNNLGQPLSLRADHDEALTCFRESLRIRKLVYGANHLVTAKAQNNLGYQLFVMGEYLAARPHYDEALKVYTTAYGQNAKNHPDTAMVENNLGFLLRSSGRFKEAREHFVKALDIYTRAGGAKHPLRATVLNNMGLLAIDDGDYIAARALLEEALAIRKEVLGPNHPDTLVTEMALAVLLTFLADPEAVNKIKDVAERLRKVLPADHPILAQAINNQALTDKTKEGRARVLDLLKEALENKRKRLGPKHPDIVFAINNLAFELMDVGELTSAEKLLKDSLAISREKLGDPHRDTSWVEVHLGLLCLSTGKYADSESYLKKAIAGFKTLYISDHPDTANALNMLAFTLAVRGKRSEALAAAGDAAAIYSTVAHKTMAGSPERLHLTMSAQWRLESRVFLTIAAVDPDQIAGYGPALFRTAMDWKAISSRSLLDRLEALTVGQVPEARQKYDEVQVYRRMLMREIMRGAGPEGVEKYDKNLKKLREEIDKRERDLGVQVKGYSSLAQAREASPAEVAKRIPAGSVLVEFVLLERLLPDNVDLAKGIFAEATYLALVVIPKPGGGDPDVKLIPLGPAKDVDETIQKWRTQAQKKKRDPVVEGQLREKVWDPLAKAIPANTKRLFIAPAGQLALIPFEAIWHDDAFLVEKYLISYCSTGRDLIPRPLPTGQPGPSVLVADPDFDHLPADAPVIEGFRPGGVSALAYASNPPQEDRLDGFTTEADAVEKLLTEKFPGQTKSRRRLEATEENVQKVVRPRVLYFITHGNFLKDQKSLITLEGRMTAPSSTPAQGETPLLGNLSGEDPRLRSYLCLTGFNRWKERAQRGLSDGMLTAREVESLDLWGTDLVVTAACKTGVGDVQVGEGVMGLRRAFQQAGARTVVTSLWSVSDEKSAILLPRFLKFYLDGTPKAEALRKAQLEMIASLRAAQPEREKKYQAAPFAWAAFICHGLPE